MTAEPAPEDRARIAELLAMLGISVSIHAHTMLAQDRTDARAAAWEAGRIDGYLAGRLAVTRELIHPDEQP